jgi:REP element-mobilizing transposase RayT
MPTDPSVAPMAEPLAYFLTWTTYGTWLPGDARGWVERPGQFRPPNAGLEAAARALLKEEPCVLDGEQRRLVEQVIARHCAIRGWHLHVVNCRTQHVHVVVTAGAPPKVVRDQFKAWCTRHLKALQRARQADPSQAVRVHWWTEGGSTRWLNDEVSLTEAITYVRDCQ